MKTARSWPKWRFCLHNCTCWDLYANLLPSLCLNQGEFWGLRKTLCTYFCKLIPDKVSAFQLSSSKSCKIALPDSPQAAPFSNLRSTLVQMQVFCLCFNPTTSTMSPFVLKLFSLLMHMVSKLLCYFSGYHEGSVKHEKVNLDHFHENLPIVHQWRHCSVHFFIYHITHPSTFSKNLTKTFIQRDLECYLHMCPPFHA